MSTRKHAPKDVLPLHVEEGLLLRALTYFVDAEVEAPLPGEGAADWDTVKRFFVARVGALLIPPEQPLAIQARSVDVRRARSRKAK
jgi:hypothetical protein